MNQADALGKRLRFDWAATGKYRAKNYGKQ